MFNCSFTILNSFGFVVVEPCLFKSLLLSNTKWTFIIILHDFDNVGDFTKPQMKEFFQYHELDFNNVLSVFGKRSRPNLFSPKNLNINQLLGLSRFLYPFQHLIHFLCFFKILLIIPRTYRNITFTRMYFDDISINFTIVFSSYVKFLIHFYILEFFSCRLLCD